MDAFELALKEFFDNGGSVEQLEYKGPINVEHTATKPKNVGRHKELVPEEIIDQLIDSDEL